MEDIKMYYKYRTIEEVIKHLNDYKTETRATIEAWKSVEIRKKKDGEEYAKISQAIVNAKFGQYYPVEDFTHPYITVHFKHDHAYKSDNLEAYYYMDTLTEEQRKNREVILHESWSRATSRMTADELRIAIQRRINQLEKHEKSLERQIENAPVMFKQYRDAIAKIEKEFEEADKQLRDIGEIYPTSLYYAIKSEQ